MGNCTSIATSEGGASTDVTDLMRQGSHRRDSCDAHVEQTIHHGARSASPTHSKRCALLSVAEDVPSPQTAAQTSSMIFSPSTAHILPSAANTWATSSMGQKTPSTHRSSRSGRVNVRPSGNVHKVSANNQPREVYAAECGSSSKRQRREQLRSAQWTSSVVVVDDRDEDDGPGGGGSRTSEMGFEAKLVMHQAMRFGDPFGRSEPAGSVSGAGSKSEPTSMTLTVTELRLMSSRDEGEPASSSCTHHNHQEESFLHSADDGCDALGDHPVGVGFHGASCGGQTVGVVSVKNPLQPRRRSVYRSVSSNSHSHRTATNSPLAQRAYLLRGVHAGSSPTVSVEDSCSSCKSISSAMLPDVSPSSSPRLASGSNRVGFGAPQMGGGGADARLSAQHLHPMCLLGAPSTVQGTTAVGDSGAVVLSYESLSSAASVSSQLAVSSSRYTRSPRAVTFY